jgi:nucleoside-diphosphate-sugar epimerase
MRIAVTGATGLVGRYVVRRLASSGHRIRCWHRPVNDLSGFERVAGKIDWIPGRLGSQEAIDALLDETDAVVHCAVAWDGPGNRGGRLEQDEVLGFLETNFMGSIRLFESAYRMGIRRFVHVSSCSVHETILNDRPLDETHPLWPHHHYGAHKAALEAFVSSYGRGKRWPICAVRPTGIYGFDRPASRSKWHDLVGKVVRGEPISSPKGGKEVHADDVAKATEILIDADAESVSGQVFNCYDRYIAEQEVATIAKEISGSRSEIADLNRGPKNQIDTSKIRALGMEFGGTELLRSTIAELVQSHRGRASS